MAKQQKSREEEMLCDIYKDCRMGEESIAKLLPKVSGAPFRDLLACQLASYQTFASQATKLLTDKSITPRDAGLFEKMPAEMGIAAGTMMDDSDSKIAQLTINGYVMGVTEMKKQLADAGDIPEPTMKLAGDFIQFQLQSICDVKQYL